jgi:hypothetical protein
VGDLFRFLKLLLRRERFAKWFALGLVLLLPWGYTELFRYIARLVDRPGVPTDELPYTIRFANWQESIFMGANWWWWIMAIGLVGGICVLMVTLCVFIAKRTIGRRALK